MAYVGHTPVMDISPWPSGRGFEGADAWWDHVLSREEKQRLDSLMGVALLDDDVCRQLLQERDEALMETFGLSAKTRAWLRSVKASTLTELAQAIMAKL